MNGSKQNLKVALTVGIASATIGALVYGFLAYVFGPKSGPGYVPITEKDPVQVVNPGMSQTLGFTVSHEIDNKLKVVDATVTIVNMSTSSDDDNRDIELPEITVSDPKVPRVGSITIQEEIKSGQVMIVRVKFRDTHRGPSKDEDWCTWTLAAR